jgi:iron complex transport system substrate-binding protein
MKKGNPAKMLAAVLAAAMLMGACGQSQATGTTAAGAAAETTAAPAQTAAAPAQTAAPASTPAPETTAAPATTAAPETTQAQATPATRFVTGSDGVTVEIPYQVDRVAPVIGALAQMTEILSEGRGVIVAAATNNISDYFREVFPDYNESNPNNYSASSVEDLIAANTQVVFGVSTLFSDEQKQQLKDAGVSFVATDNVATVDGLCETYTIIGDILGGNAPARAKEFVEYYRNAIDDSKARTAGVTERKKVLELFYSADSFTTVNSTDISNTYVEAAGGVNVAADYTVTKPSDGSSGGRGGASQLTVDAEQIVAWNPDLIVVGSQAGRDVILSDPAIQTVTAVKNGDVYVCPYGIYLWNVRSGEGAMVSPWLGKLLYPELFEDVDPVGIVKDYFKRFYNTEITDEKAEQILAGDASNAMTR